ncbi:MAG: hypothetical protein LBJ18_00485 [Rickettsiales bacterium]|jgi:hypothetical protein|nr:hypothetical protein [Rickettsiales bacterium]
MKIKKRFSLQNKMCALGAFCLLTFAFGIGNADAAVVSRASPTMPVRAAPRANMTNQMPVAAAEPVQEIAAEPVVAEAVQEVAPAQVIEDKSAQFGTAFDKSGGATPFQNDIKEQIDRQRAGLANAELGAAYGAGVNWVLAGGANNCDQNLRDCMQKKCGDNFSKCAKDTDTIWGDKINSCRLSTKCTGEEFSAFAPEIKADRDMDVIVGAYMEVITCGQKYNQCIVQQCGADLHKCLGQKAGAAAVNVCKGIADSCAESDSGLSPRASNVFAGLRGNAEIGIKKDEKRLYELRDLMQAQCTRFGASFDQRTFSCVYSVEFFADDMRDENGSVVPRASKKVFSGDTFDCNQDWFGLDITTYRENAARRTREQTAASSAMLGAGLGIAAGAISSGAIDRAMDRQKAENATDKLGCESSGGTFTNVMNIKSCKCPGDSKWDSKQNTCVGSEKALAAAAKLEKDCAGYGADVLNHKECNDTDAYDDADKTLSAEKKAEKKAARDEKKAKEKEEKEAKEERCKETPDADECKSFFQKAGGAIGGAAKSVGSAVGGVAGKAVSAVKGAVSKDKDSTIKGAVDSEVPKTDTPTSTPDPNADLNLA